MKYNLEWARREYDSGVRRKVIPFWGHTRDMDSPKMTKACLSQWYPCEFAVEGVAYRTAEQYMMAQKAILFGDRGTAQKIMSAETPSEYKSLGREVVGFDQATWDARKADIVLSGTLAKFSQNPELRVFLLGTGDALLVEASPYDGIWGVRLGIRDSGIDNPNCWRGENLLGFSLMEARDVLRGDADETSD